jgi:hypothetical protein
MPAQCRRDLHRPLSLDIWLSRLALVRHGALPISSSTETCLATKAACSKAGDRKAQ